MEPTTEAHTLKAHIIINIVSVVNPGREYPKVGILSHKKKSFSSVHARARLGLLGRLKHRKPGAIDVCIVSTDPEKLVRVYKYIYIYTHSFYLFVYLFIYLYSVYIHTYMYSIYIYIYT